ncbi:gloL [Symbiodinium sp. KB8]|nr:gloL [Symbiodinium sp. KB8]
MYSGAGGGDGSAVYHHYGHVYSGTGGGGSADYQSGAYADGSAEYGAYGDGSAGGAYGDGSAEYHYGGAYGDGSASNGSDGRYSYGSGRYGGKYYADNGIGYGSGGHDYVHVHGNGVNGHVHVMGPASKGHYVSHSHGYDGHEVKHIIEKNYYDVQTKTHVIRKPIPVSGPVHYQSVVIPAKPLEDCFRGYSNYKKLLAWVLWDTQKQRYCCYKYKRACTTQYVKKYHYHTVVHKKEVPVEVAKTVAACLKVEGKQRQLLDVVWTACLDRVKLQASWLTHGQQQGSVVVKIEHLHSELRTLNMSRVQAVPVPAKRRVITIHDQEEPKPRKALIDKHSKSSSESFGVSNLVFSEEAPCHPCEGILDLQAVDAFVSAEGSSTRARAWPTSPNRDQGRIYNWAQETARIIRTIMGQQDKESQAEGMDSRAGLTEDNLQDKQVIHYDVPKPETKIIHKTKVIKKPVPVVHYVDYPVKKESKPKVVIHTEHVMSEAYDCHDGMHHWKGMWSHSKRLYCCWRTQIGCPHTHIIVKNKTEVHTKYVKRKVKMPSQVIYKDVTEVVHKHIHSLDFDCNSGYSNWYYGWSPKKKHWCCHQEKLGCPGTWKGFIKGKAKLVLHHHEGHATGTLYDCDAGFSNWIHGWSNSKKDWCCENEHKGCGYHCDGESDDWSTEHREWCCGNFQKGCAVTTLSPLGCDAPCTLHGDTSTCQERVDWTKENTFVGRDNACALAYSQVQVECDVCRACTVEAAGCEVDHGAASDPYDCNAALNNFFRAWSPGKKQWCCNNQGKGCEGEHPPSVDPGAGMMWKHVQVNGYWTWQVVSVGGHAVGGAVSLPYDCNVGRVNWMQGWSEPKKTYCCAHAKFGCPGDANVAAGHTVVTHHTYTTVSHGGGGHMVGGHMVGGHMVGGHMVAGHMVGGHAVGGHMVGGHAVGGHMVGGHVAGGGAAAMHIHGGGGGATYHSHTVTYHSSGGHVVTHVHHS